MDFSDSSATFMSIIKTNFKKATQNTQILQNYRQNLRDYLVKSKI